MVDWDAGTVNVYGHRDRVEGSARKMGRKPPPMRLNILDSRGGGRRLVVRVSGCYCRSKRSTYRGSAMCWFAAFVC